jgi:hypothetical protein
MKRKMVLVLTGLLVIACGVIPGINLQATVEAAVEATLAARPTIPPFPTMTRMPTAAPPTLPPAPSATPTATLVSPETPLAQGSPYADGVVDFVRGPIPDTHLELMGYVPENLLGVPDAVTEPCCSGLFQLGTGGSIIVEFVDNTVVDEAGPDLYIVGDPNNDEGIQVEVSVDGVVWRDFGVVREMSVLDLGNVGLAYIKYVRITDDGVSEAEGNNSAELDAVQALHSGPAQ